MDLTYKQRLFVEAYLGKANGNATEAARIAGFAWPEKQGYQQLGKTRIKAAIAAKLDKAAMPANEVLARLSEIASGSLEPFLLFQGPIWSIDLTKAKRRGKLRLLKKIKPTKDGTEIEIHSPIDALDKLAKYHALYVERKEVKNVSDGASFESVENPRDKDIQASTETEGVREE